MPKVTQLVSAKAGILTFGVSDSKASMLIHKIIKARTTAGGNRNGRKQKLEWGMIQKYCNVNVTEFDVREAEGRNKTLRIGAGVGSWQIEK